MWFDMGFFVEEEKQTNHMNHIHTVVKNDMVPNFWTDSQCKKEFCCTLVSRVSNTHIEDEKSIHFCGKWKDATGVLHIMSRLYYSVSHVNEVGTGLCGWSCSCN